MLASINVFLVAYLVVSLAVRPVIKDRKSGSSCGFCNTLCYGQ